MRIQDNTPLGHFPSPYLSHLGQFPSCQGVEKKMEGALFEVDKMMGEDLSGRGIV